MQNNNNNNNTKNTDKLSTKSSQTKNEKDDVILEQQRAQLIDRALLLGASNALIYKIFAWQNSAVTNRRKKLGINSKAGRKSLLVYDTQIEVWHAWIDKVGKDYHPAKTKNQTIEELAIMLEIAEQFRLNLTAVYAMIKRAYKHI